MLPLVFAQSSDAGDEAGEETLSPSSENLQVSSVKVQGLAQDGEIRKRIENILKATGRFTNHEVRVEDGVVFLKGQTQSKELKEWAGELARKTQDVAAVANQIEVAVPSIWDFHPAWSRLLNLWREIIRSLPLFLFALFILALSAGAGLLTIKGSKSFFQDRIHAKLLRSVFAGALGALVMLTGVYIILRVSGLTQLALTVVGGTGLVGLALGIAFRDISENFLASIFLSVQKPFETNDLVEISGITGYVQQLNMRTTVLMSLDGNLVQIPNSVVYKSNIRNFTANVNRREDIVVGIGYDDSINKAQEVVRKVLANNPAVLNDPEPAVLADSFGKATINLRIYFWLNGREHSWLKVRSSVIRLVKLALQKNGISMPDEAREIIFPEGVSVSMLEESPEKKRDSRSKRWNPCKMERIFYDLVT